VTNAGRAPTFSDNVFVAPNAAVIGDVKVGKNSSIWYGATVRGTYRRRRFLPPLLLGPSPRH
jgi:carbonic anhydrase/acetyltransferase-like protein (isoleucine patch superfamily)